MTTYKEDDAQVSAFETAEKSHYPEVSAGVGETAKIEGAEARNVHNVNDENPIQRPAS